MGDAAHGSPAARWRRCLAACCSRERARAARDCPISMYQTGGYQQQPGGFAPPGGFGPPGFGSQQAPGGAPFGGHAQNPYHGNQAAPKQQDDRYGGKGKQDPVLAVSRCGARVWSWAPGANCDRARGLVEQQPRAAPISCVALLPAQQAACTAA